MPHAMEEYQHIQVKPIVPTFGAEVCGVDFSHEVPNEVFREIHKAITKYGVLVFRHAGLDDAHHVAFSRLFGELDDIRPYLTLGRKNRFDFLELFDVSNLEEDGSISKIGSSRHHMNLGNGIFHTDSSFNSRRAGFSLLRGHRLPPPGHGGNTDFADTRTACDDLPKDLLDDLQTNNYIGCHSLVHSRKRAAPKDSQWLQSIDPETRPFGRHSILQTHETSGRQNLYIAAHLHHLEYPNPHNPDFKPTPTQPFERVPEPKSTELIESILAHASQPKYVISIEWQNDGDLLVWDNTCVMHRAGHNPSLDKYVRDMRRTTVHDGSVDAWGWNEKVDSRQGFA